MVSICGDQSYNCDFRAAHESFGDKYLENGKFLWNTCGNWGSPVCFSFDRLRDSHRKSHDGISRTTDVWDFYGGKNVGTIV